MLVVLVLGGVDVDEAGTGDKCVSGTGLGLASVVDSGVGVGNAGRVAEDVGGAGGGLPKCFLLVLMLAVSVMLVMTVEAVRWLLLVVHLLVV